VSLGWKAGVVFVMMLIVGALMLLARRRNFDKVRKHYTTRRTRIAIVPRDSSTTKEGRESDGPGLPP
jgi:hypothetical protein